MLIEINRLIVRRRRTLTVLTATLALGGAVVLAHGFIGTHMGGMSGMDSPAAICLAVAETAAVWLALAAVVRARRLGDPLTTLLPWAMPSLPAPAVHSVAMPARAGPPLLQVFRL